MPYRRSSMAFVRFDAEEVRLQRKRRAIVRAGARRRLDYNGLGMTDYLLPRLSGELELLVCELKPGGESGAEAYTHEGEEAGIVMEGELELWVGAERYHLAPSDSFGFPSPTPHRYRNPAQSVTRIVWSITPPTF